MIVRIGLSLTIAWLFAAANCLAQSGFGGRQTNQSFSGGFSGLSQPQYQQRPPQQYQQQQQYRPAPPRSGTSTMAGLEQVLNQVDNSNWNNVPVSGNRQPPQQMQPQSMMGAAPAMSGGGGGGMFPKMSRQEMTRIFFEGGSPMGMGGMGMGMGGGGGGAAPPQNNSQATSTAYSNYQTACNEETKSRNYANTARYDSSQWNRKNAADQAYYAANNANYAAQRAESAAYNGGSEAQGYARLARDAANRARENANQARYNADTIR